MPIAPPTALHQQLHGFLDLPLIRIALLNHRHGNAVRAENDLRQAGHGETAQSFLHFLHDRVQIYRITIETLDAMHPGAASKQPMPLVQTRSRGGGGILRVERQEDNLVALRLDQPGYGLAGEWMPVAHSHETTRIQAEGIQFTLKRTRLLLGIAADGRASADGGVMMLYFAGAGGGNQFGQRFAPNAGEGKVNDFGVAEEIVKKRFYRFQAVGSAQLE